MKLKRKIKNNVILSFVTTLLILSVIDLSFVPQTNSKFKTAGGNDELGIALEYNVGLHKLYRKGETYTYTDPNNIPTTNPKITANQENQSFTIEFSFPRQREEITKDVNGEKLDNYTVSLPLEQLGCSITEVNSDSTSAIIDDKNKNKISFNKPSVETETVKVKLQCGNTVVPVNGKIELSTSVREQIGTEKSFAYTDYSFVMSEDYYNEIMGIDTWTNPLMVHARPPLTLQTKFLEFTDGYYNKFIKPYYVKNGYTEEDAQQIFNNYMHLNSNYMDYIITTGSKYKQINGLDIYNGDITIGTKTANGYIYTIKDSLLGYILTANDSNPNNMYFSNKLPANATEEQKEEVKNELETAFEIYLREIYTDEADFNAVWNYVAERGGIYSVVIEKKKILGIGNYFSSSYQLKISDNLLAYATSLKYGDTTSHDFGKNWSENHNFYFEAMTNIKDSIVSPYLKPIVNSEGVTSNGKLDNLIYNSIYMNNEEEYSTPMSFIDYYITYDEGGKNFGDYENPYVITKAWSNVGVDANDTKNHYKFWKMEIPKEVTIEFINYNDPIKFPYLDADTLDIKITHSEVNAMDEIMQLVDTLNKELGLNITSDDIFPDEDVTDKTVVTISISKGCGVTSGSCNVIIPGTESTSTTNENTNTVQNSPKVDTPTEDINGTESVQNSIIKVTEAVDVAATKNVSEEETKESTEEEIVEENNEVEEEKSEEKEDSEETSEENTRLPMISSIMKFMFRK